ncbi:MAG: NADPH-dependent F420 reductase [Halobacteriaceae archaeon]
MEIGIIGTGDVGRALARGFSDAGHEIVLGSRTPARTTAAFDVMAHQETVLGSDLVVLAVPAAAATDLATSLSDALAGTTIVDPTNEYPNATADRSVAERIAAAAPDARVVKAFNTIGANRLDDPVIDGQPVSMFVAGDDPDARDTVAGLADDVGFAPVIAGGLPAADHLENLARFWIDLSTEFGRDVGFQLRGLDTR